MYAIHGKFAKHITLPWWRLTCVFETEADSFLDADREKLASSRVELGMGARLRVQRTGRGKHFVVICSTKATVTKRLKSSGAMYCFIGHRKMLMKTTDETGSSSKLSTSDVFRLHFDRYFVLTVVFISVLRAGHRNTLMKTTDKTGSSLTSRQTVWLKQALYLWRL